MPAALTDLKDICVAGVTPFTTIDFPGRLAGVFYLQGCPWRCRYCYNSEFWPLPSKETALIPVEKILEFLNARKGHLDGIVFSGGEPTAHEHLPVWMRVVKEFGFQVGLHTGGMFPERLKAALALCDWVGMDIKAPFGAYERVTRIAGSGAPARKSAELIIATGVPYEFRTTLHPSVLSEDDVLTMARELVAMGCGHYALQMFRSEHCPDKELRENGVPRVGVSLMLRMELQKLFSDFQVRE